MTKKCFVFFVQTGKEQMVCNYLNNVIQNKNAIAFIPQIRMIYKNSRHTYKELKPMLPGYVFLLIDIDARIFVINMLHIIRRSNHIIKLLGKENIDYMSLNDDEKDLLFKFCDQDYIVNESIGVIVGDRVSVNSGPLKGFESLIKKIDRHKRRVEIELNFMGDIRRISVSLQIIKKI